MPPNRKYASEGGPVFRDCFALLRRAATRPAREVLKLADAAIFNLIIGNADAHAKNFSLLRMADGTTVLAPLYDLVATHMWSGLHPRLAMRFGGASTLEEIDGESFDRFAADTGLAAPFLKRRAAALANQMQSVLQSVPKGSPLSDLQNTGAIDDLAEKTSDRAARLALKIGSSLKG